MDDYTFPIPSIARNNITKYPKTLAFDFEKGEFKVNGKGDLMFASPEETCEAWCHKAINIERYSKLSYSNNLGIETNPLELYDSTEAKESWLIRTVTETFFADPLKRILSVNGFNFDYTEPDAVELTCIVTLKNGVSFDFVERFENGGF